MQECISAVVFVALDGDGSRPDHRDYTLADGNSYAVAAVRSVGIENDQDWPMERPKWWDCQDEEFFNEKAALSLPAPGGATHAIELEREPQKGAPLYAMHERELAELRT